MRRVFFYFLFFSERAARGVGGGALPDFFFFFFPCSADHERAGLATVSSSLFGLETNALNVRNNHEEVM